MKNFYMFVILGILTVSPISVMLQESPVLKLYEVDEHNNIVRHYDRGDDKATAVIIDNLDHLRLECQASYPVQWTYAGNGIPITSSTMIQERTHNQYTASVFLGHLNEGHTGTYKCDHPESFNPSQFIHIFVPGQNLFTSGEGKTIEILDNESSILIPCSVSHPRVRVSLEKLTENGLVKPVTKSDNAIIYTPRKGFRINLDEIVDPEGTYVCKAQYNGIERSVEYRVVTLLEFNRRPEETCRGESCASHCSTHSDCPPMMNCYADHLCRDPCTYSIQCGKESLCRVVSNVPICYCPPGFVGDATTECFIP